MSRGQLPCLLPAPAVAVSKWLGWSGMAAKVPNCQCISLQASTGMLKDPQLHRNGVPIPFTLDPVRFLGRNIHVHSTIASSKDTILSKLNSIMKAVDRTPTTRWQKLLLFSGAVFPRLTCPLLIQEFSTTWVEKQLDSITTRYLKRLAGLSKPANTAQSPPPLHSPSEAAGITSMPVADIM